VFGNTRIPQDFQIHIMPLAPIFVIVIAKHCGSKPLTF
jgi:hypothetical protein